MSDPKSAYLKEIYFDGLSGINPLTTNLDKLESLARQKLPPQAYAYVAGSASSETTAVSNRKAFEKWQIVPQMLCNVSLSDFDSTTRILGKDYPTPLVIAPIGVQAQLHPDADYATAAAASELQIPFTLSSAASRSIETVYQNGQFEQNQADAWFQLYWPLDDDLTESILCRAKKTGYRVLVVTLDTWSLGWRPRDLDTTYNPFLTGQGVAHLFSDPVFVQKYCDGKSPLRKEISKEEIVSASVSAVGQLSSGISRNWNDLALLRKLWGDGPIVLKGIQTVSDAARAIQAGMDGIWVSNHGGRQVDGAVASLGQLSAISDYIRSVQIPQGNERLSIIFDSGVRTGADVFKALCLGADAVAIGRPYAYGLAVDGQKGVTSVLKSILADFEINSALAGFQSVSQMTRTALVRADSKI